VTSSVAVFETAIWVKSVYMRKIMIENSKKKIENMEIKEIFYINLHLKDRLQMEFTAC